MRHEPNRIEIIHYLRGLAFADSPVIAAAGLITAIAIAFGRSIRLNGIPGRALTYWGTISYSLYLVHVPIGGRVVNLGSRFVHGQFEHLLMSGLALLVTLAFAHVFYTYIERPALRKARQLVYLPVSRKTQEVACQS